MIRGDEIRRRADLALELVQTMCECESTLDELLSVREVPLAVPSGFFRTSIAPPPPPHPAPPRGPSELAFSLGDKIRSAREARKMTQKELADNTGIKRPNIARLERGTGLPNLSTLLTVANGLGVPLTSLLERS